MSLTMDRDEPFKRYTGREIEQILRAEDLDRDDRMYLSAVFAQIYVLEDKNDPSKKVAAGHQASDVVVYEVEDHETGVFRVFGKVPIILINSNDMYMDYTVISDMHPIPDAEFYVLSTDPFAEQGENLGYWHRDDAIAPDYMPRFNGVLDWPDLNPDDKDKESDNDEDVE